MTAMNPPYSPLAHLGCAFCIIIAAIGGTIATASPDFHSWLMGHYYVCLLAFPALLAAAYLLEHALTTAAMLTLLAAADICAGLAVAGLLPPEAAEMLWQLSAGPICYFCAAALVLHRWPGQLYRWQLSCIFIAAALAGAGMVCWLTDAFPVATLGALLITLVVATFELITLFSREYYELTGETRTRSTAVAMVLLQAMPVCKISWNILRGSYYGLWGILRVAYQFFRWF